MPAAITPTMGDRTAPAEQRIVVRRPRDLFDLIGRGLGDARDELVLVCLLDRDGAVLSLKRVARGDAIGCALPVPAILRGAVGRRAAGIIVAHNHPSGDPAPSAADVAATRRLATGAALLGIELLDHLVVAGGRWSSMRVLGLL